MSPVCEKKENALLLRCLCLILFTSSSAGLVQEKIPPKTSSKSNKKWVLVYAIPYGPIPVIPVNYVEIFFVFWRKNDKNDKNVLVKMELKHK
jgi:hypothetical protein